MAFYDEFVSNFDLNQLLGENEENVQVQVPAPQERIKKTSLWLKSKIISSDMLIQNYLTKTEDYLQAVKAHAVTKEDLKNVCINYKETMEKCQVLEDEKKVMLANQEVLENRATDAENRYSALMSHTNQLKSLVKQLETEKEALLLEKQLEKCNDKKVIILQKEKEHLLKEKETLLNDITALKEVIKSKKKNGKQQNVLKRNKQHKISNDSIMSTSDESDNESHLINEFHNYAMKDSKSPRKQNFIDIDSDSSNGEVSIDTGRGSSRANSEKCLLSPDYFIPDTLINKPHKDVEVSQVDIATSPIKIEQSVTVATSPIGVDYPGSLHEDLCGDHSVQNFDGPDYIIDEVPICDESFTINELFTDACTSPIPKSPDFRTFIDTGTSPMKCGNDITFKGDENFAANLISSDQLRINETNQETIDSENPMSKCLCEKQKFLVDVGTNTAVRSPEYRKFVDKDTNTDIKDNADGKRCVRRSLFISKGDIDDFGQEIKNKQVKNFCEKSTCTKIEVVNACTSPISGIYKLIDKATSPIKNLNNRMSENACPQLPRKTFVQKESEQELNTIEECGSKVLYKNKDSKSREKPNKTQESIVQEQICLENHNSNNLLYENTNDDEVQSILNVMKLHCVAVSPLPKTPIKIREPQSTSFDILLNNYEKSALKLDHLLNYVEDIRGQMIRNVTELRNKCASDVSNDFSDGTNTACTAYQDKVKMSAMEINREKSFQNMSENKQITTNNELIEIFEEDIIGTSNLPNKSRNNIVEDNICNKTVEIAVPVKPDINKEKISSQSQEMTSDNDLNESDDNIVNLSSTNDSNIANITESPIKIFHADMPVVNKLNVRKTKTKSKLEKLRKKLIPTSKIKCDIPSTGKQISKAYKTIPKELTLPSLDHEIAYQKAVKVMAELKSNQKLQDKGKVNSSSNTTYQVEESATLEHNKIEPTSRLDLFESNPISPRSGIRRQGKKEEVSTVSDSVEKEVVLQNSIENVQKSPIRRGRKRVADNELHRLQGSKRVLRSSNACQATNKIDLPINQINCVDEDLHNNDTANKNEFKESEKNTNVMQTENEPYMSVNPVQGRTLNLIDVDIGPNNSSTVTQNNHNGSTKPDQSMETDICLKEGSLIETRNVLNLSCTEPNKGSSPHSALDKIKAKAEGSNSRKVTSTNNLQENQRGIDSGLNILHSHLIKENDNKLSEIKRRAAIMSMRNPVVEVIPLENDVNVNCKNNVINYKDLDIFSEQTNSEDKVHNKLTRANQHLKENILCSALDRYGVISVKYVAKKVPDTITNSICQKIEDGIADIIGSPNDQQKTKMDDLVNGVRNFKKKYILSGLMKYLKDPTRKCELFNKIMNGLAPPMTKAEVILLYVIEHLNRYLPSGDFINRVWNNIEHALFQLNHAPHFDVIESMSHFYAVMCRYFRNKSRLRCFMLDAMYCLQFKAVPLIRQCLDVCQGVLPNANERMAKTSLVTCLVYLLHFYKCQDKFNRAQDIRTILYQKYSYRFSEWNETMILEIFRKAIMDLRGTQNDKKMLRLALIILCKRHGAKWCQTNIINNMLLPIIEKQEVPERIKQFCVLMLGPLLKPFPADRKAHCEIVINQLFQMLQQNPSHGIKEAIYSSLIFMNKHDPDRVVQALLTWNPRNISKDFEEILNDYVMEKPLAIWKKIVTKKPNVCT